MTTSLLRLCAVSIVVLLSSSVAYPQDIITTVAGNGVFGFGGDGGPATSASLASPIGVAVDGTGNLFIADLANNRVRKVDTAGIITTVAGNGAPGFSGDGGPATSANLSNPRDVEVDGAGNLFIADIGNQRIRRVTRTLTPSEAIQKLISDVVALNLQQGISNSLDAKLDAALQALDDVNQNNNVAAINSLQAFINFVDAQRGGQISDADADALIAATQEIITLLGG